MASVVSPAHPIPARPEQWSTRIIFFIAGVGAAAWAPLVPFAKARAGIGDGVLGLLLLCLGMGSIVAMPLAGALAARFGCRRVLTVAASVICLILPFLATVSSLPPAGGISVCIWCRPWVLRRDHQHSGSDC
jgi:predicted MFS family arabinose efflux permease